MKLSTAEIDSLLFVEQASTPATPTSGFGRLFVKADGVYFVDDAVTVTGPLGTGGGGGGSSLLAETVYDPAETNVNATTTAFADIDATNLTITFTAPASGRVHVELETLVSPGTSTTIHWNLRDASGDVAGTDFRVAYQSLQVRGNGKVLVSGLTSGTSYTYKWGHARTIGTGAAWTGFGGVNGPAYMRVYDATI